MGAGHREVFGALCDPLRCGSRRHRTGAADTARSRGAGAQGGSMRMRRALMVAGSIGLCVAGILPLRAATGDAAKAQSAGPSAKQQSGAVPLPKNNVRRVGAFREPAPTLEGARVFLDDAERRLFDLGGKGAGAAW